MKPTNDHHTFTYSIGWDKIMYHVHVALSLWCLMIRLTFKNFCFHYVVIMMRCHRLANPTFRINPKSGSKISVHKIWESLTVPLYKPTAHWAILLLSKRTCKARRRSKYQWLPQWSHRPPLPPRTAPALLRPAWSPPSPASSLLLLSQQPRRPTMTLLPLQATAEESNAWRSSS